MGSTAPSGALRTRLFHVEHLVWDRPLRAVLFGHDCFTWNTWCNNHSAERCSSNNRSGSEEWALCRDSHTAGIPIRCRPELPEELVAKPIVEAHTGHR